MIRKERRQPKKCLVLLTKLLLTLLVSVIFCLFGRPFQRFKQFFFIILQTFIFVYMRTKISPRMQKKQTTIIYLIIYYFIVFRFFFLFFFRK